MWAFMGGGLQFLLACRCILSEGCIAGAGIHTGVMESVTLRADAVYDDELATMTMMHSRARLEITYEAVYEKSNLIVHTTDTIFAIMPLSFLSILILISRPHRQMIV